MRKSDMFRAISVIVFLALICTLSGSMARAESELHTDFANHFFKACMPFALRGRPPDGYLRSAVSRTSVRVADPDAAEGAYEKVIEIPKLRPAEPALAPDLLQGRTGHAYVQVDPNTPMSLALSDMGICSVAASNMPDIDQLVAATEKQLTTFSPRFSKKDQNTLNAADGSVITSREYAAEVDGRKFLVIFSTTPTPGLDQVGQVVVTVSKTAD